MRVIDLLNHIANNGVDEELIHIKYYNRNDEENDICMLCYENIISKLNNGCLDLNDEVEIIEEDKKIETIDPIDYCHSTDTSKDMVLVEKINEIIQVLNEMREDK